MPIHTPARGPRTSPTTLHTQLHPSTPLHTPPHHLQVETKDVTERTLAARLQEHIERIDTDLVRPLIFTPHHCISYSYYLIKHIASFY